MFWEIPSSLVAIGLPIKINCMVVKWNIGPPSRTHQECLQVAADLCQQELCHFLYHFSEAGNSQLKEEYKITIPNVRVDT